MGHHEARPDPRPPRLAHTILTRALSEALAKGMPPRRLALPIVSLGRADREADPGNYFLCRDDVGSLMMAAARGCPAYALSALGYMRKDDPAPLDVNGEWLIELLCSTTPSSLYSSAYSPSCPLRRTARRASGA